MYDKCSSLERIYGGNTSGNDSLTNATTLEIDYNQIYLPFHLRKTDGRTRNHAHGPGHVFRVG